ncbi:MAG: DUF2332 domain-containing protein [Chloroflexi bacterium]|nr:DUF2332 domain-containing protein [Chloroflexota bacterium]
MIAQRSAEFHRFARLREAKRSPLYSHLAACIAKKPQRYLPFLEVIPAHEQAPNLLFAAIQFLLLRDPNAPLAEYYSSIHDPALPPAKETGRLFSDYCQRHREQIIPLLRTRCTQTNEVSRGLAIHPATQVIQSRSEGMPLVWMEIGCSAGLNLIWDQYGYHYVGEPGQEWFAGRRDSALLLSAKVKGSIPLPVSDKLPEIRRRIGIDLHPLNLHSEADVQWLEALIWPEHRDRLASLRQAISIAREFSLDLRRGDALALLPGITAELSADCAPVFFHSYVTQQLTPEERSQLPLLIMRISRPFRHAFHLWHERSGTSPYPELGLRQLHFGEIVDETQLADVEAHVRWLEWKTRAS